MRGEDSGVLASFGHLTRPRQPKKTRPYRRQPPVAGPHDGPPNPAASRPPPGLPPARVRKSAPPHPNSLTTHQITIEREWNSGISGAGESGIKPPLPSAPAAPHRFGRLVRGATRDSLVFSASPPSAPRKREGPADPIG
ncbi:hypothetical protein E2562_016956, partial [Oryza meyeriana var. granulata]